MGTMQHLKAIALEGNPLRKLRRDIVMVTIGTIIYDGIKPNQTRHAIIDVLIAQFTF